MTEMEKRTTRAGLVAVLTLVGAIMFALIVRGGTLVVGIALLFLLFVLGCGGGVFRGVAVFVTLLAIFQHANVRLRFPFVRWIIPTPEWHHWHHAIDDEARDKNFGLPVVDKLFGTAHMPKGKRPV